MQGEVWPLFIPSCVNVFSVLGTSFEFVGHSNAAILSSLNGNPGYECVQSTSHTDVNTKMKRNSCKIIYDFPDLPWLSDPPVTKGLRAPTQQGDDTFGLWHSTTKRPATDRNFNPKDKSSCLVYEDSKGRPKLTCPPSECASDKFRELLESDPLVRSETGNKKVLDLPIPFFKKPQIAFSEIPLFAITENHAKMCLANLAAMAQVCKGIQEYFVWIVESMDKKVDLSSYGGTSSPG